MRLTKEWRSVKEEYKPALNPIQNVEADVAQEHMDKELTRIINGKQALITFAERYPNIKPARYSKK